jgi:hypothetical protein
MQQAPAELRGPCEEEGPPTGSAASPTAGEGGSGCTLLRRLPRPSQAQLADRYSKFDPETGDPTHDKDGAELEGKVRAAAARRGQAGGARALQRGTPASCLPARRCLPPYAFPPT